MKYVRIAENMEEKHASLPEVNFNDIVDFFRKYIYILCGIVLFSVLLGLIYSFFVPKSFTAQTILLPEYKIEAGRSSFFSMAVGGSVGFDGAEKLAPDFYPNILSSVPFGQFLLSQPITDEAGIEYATLKDYLSKEPISSGIVSRILSIFKNGEAEEKTVSKIDLKDKDILILDNYETALVTRVMAPISCNLEIKSGGTITIAAEMTDPVIAAQLVEYSKKYLINYVEDYRSSKVSEQSKFLAGRVGEAQKKLKESEYALQNYKDRNRDAYLNVARIQEQRLQSDYSLALSIYNDLVFKLEQAKIKEKEDKPVFKVLEPTRVPLFKSGPNHKMYGLIGGILGFILAFGFVAFYKEKLHLKLLNIS